MMQNQSNDININELNFSKIERILGIRPNINQDTGNDTGSITFNFFNHQIRFSQGEFHNIEGKPITDALKNIFYQYLIECPGSICKSSDKLVTLREFSDSGPLFSRFTANINKTIETTFSGQLKNLLSRCHTLGGITINNSSYDLSVRFIALSKISLILNFNDKDDMMPASAVFLFYDNANNYLDLKGLGTLLTYLTGQLIQQK